jgi:hypothetical protein
LDALTALLAAGLVLVSLPIGGPLAALAAMAALDVPVGFRSTATDFISGGGWAVLALGVLAALGLALYAARRRRPTAAVGVSTPGTPHD